MREASSANPIGKLMRRVREKYRETAMMQPRLKGLRAYSNWLRGNIEIQRGTDRVKTRPWKITFDPTNICQLRCPLCPTGLRIQDRETGRASLHMFEHLLEELGSYLFFIDFFNWGEPLLNPQIENFIAAATSRQIVTAISTNLSLPLSDDRIQRLVTSGLGELRVSLDGASAETYKQYRRQGDFDLVCSNIRRIVAEKKRLGLSSPLITWQFLVFRFNEHEVPAAEALAKDLGVDRLDCTAPYLDVDRYPLTPEDRKLVSTWQPANPEFHTPESPRPEPRCGWHYVSSAVNWDGTVAPCCTVFNSHDDFGTMGRDGATPYMNIINNDKFVLARRRFAGKEHEPIPLVCEKCPTPSIMPYHKYLNRHIAFVSAVALAQTVSRSFRSLVRSRRGRAAALGIETTSARKSAAVR